MNQKSKPAIPKHTDPRETREKVPSREIKDLSRMMKESGSTPYRYVRASLKKLAEGDYNQAMDWLDYAGEFSGVFYKKGSKEDRSYKDQINILRLTMLFLIENFKDLKPEE